MDLQFLRPLYEDFGGYVSVYLDTSLDAEDAAEAIDLRWRSARERLASDGADDATLDALGAVLTGRGAPGRAAFGRGGEVLLTEPLPHPPRRRSPGWRRCRMSCRCSRRAARTSRTCV